MEINTFCHDKPGHGVTRRWLRAIGTWSALGPWGFVSLGNAGMIWPWHTLVASKSCCESQSFAESAVNIIYNIWKFVITQNYLFNLIFDMWLPFFLQLLLPLRASGLRSKASGDPFAHNHRWAVDGDFALPESSGGKFVHQQNLAKTSAFLGGRNLIPKRRDCIESR